MTDLPDNPLVHDIGDVTDVLLRARDLIADPDRWCAEVSARDGEGFEVEPWEDEAVKWCAIGALAAVTLGNSGAWWGAKERLAFEAFSGWGMPTTRVNDELGHDAAIELFNKAIDTARGEITR